MFSLNFKENTEIFMRRFESDVYLKVFINKTKHINTH